MLQYYRIADLIVAMDTYGRTERQAQKYLTEECQTVDIVIKSYADFMKKRNPLLSDDDAEYMGTAACFIRELLRYNGFRLHSSAVVVDGKAYLFSANSGTGKSTHTQLWLDLFGEKAYILNDDKPVLRLIDGVWYAYGTPWSGKHDISVNTCVPVAGIAMMERSLNNVIEPYAGANAIFDVLTQSNKPKASEYRIKLLELLDSLFTKVPIWKLRCNVSQEAAIIAYEAMSGRKWIE